MPTFITRIRTALRALTDPEAGQDVVHDLRHAVRSLARNRGMACVAVLSLSLGMGANTAIFSVLNTVLLQSLPVRDPQSLVVLSHRGKDDASEQRAHMANVPLYEFLRDRSRSYAGLLAFSTTHLRLRRDEATVAVSAQWVSSNYFSVLGVGAALGRTWQPDDEERPEVAVISDRLWQRELGSDPGTIGRAIILNGRSVTIVGVLPPEFGGLRPGTPVDVTLLLAAQPILEPAQGNMITLGRGANDEPMPLWPLFLVGRLNRHVSVTSAEAETTVLLRQWATHRGASADAIAGSFSRAVLTSGGKGLDALRRRFGAPLWVLMGIVGSVFLIACGNVANLLLVRGTARQHEFAVRSALGASRGRLIRQMLSEGLVLTSVGGAAGLLLGGWGSSLLGALMASGRTAVELEVQLDWRVLLFAAGVSLLSGIGVGLVPALQLSRRATATTLNGGLSRGSGSGAGWWGRVLVVAQIAVSLCLLVTTGLFVGNLRQITAIDSGFEPSHLLSVSFDWSAAGYSRPQMMAFIDQAVETVAALPGVQAASATHVEPLGEQQSQRWFTVRPGGDNMKTRVVELNVVSGDYFRTLRLPVVRGRAFDSRDRADSPKVALISETLAHACFGEIDPVGQLAWIARDTKGVPLTIVGVVRDSRQRDLREAPLAFLFLPATQSMAWEMNLLVRSAGDPTVLATDLRRALTTLGRDLPIREITTPRRHLERTLLQERLLATLSGFFGPLAMLLAAIGLYGLLAYNVARRTREIGIRVALGARMGGVIALVLRQGLALVAIGTAVGFGVVLGLARVLRRFLFALSPLDPVVFAAAVGVLGVVAALACLVPALRAAKVDPMLALRQP